MLCVNVERNGNVNGKEYIVKSPASIFWQIISFSSASSSFVSIVMCGAHVIAVGRALTQAIVVQIVQLVQLLNLISFWCVRALNFMQKMLHPLSPAGPHILFTGRCDHKKRRLDYENQRDASSFGCHNYCHSCRLHLWPIKR